MKSHCAYCGGESHGAEYCCIGCENLDGNFNVTQKISSKYSELDLPQIKDRYRLTQGTFDYRLHVEGLHCASCIHLIERLPEFDCSIIKARIDFAMATLSIQVTSEFSLARLLNLLSSWGYNAHFLEIDENIQARIKLENKLLLKRLAVTGACAGNIMLFVIPIYSGLEGSWKNIFNWASFLLFLPVIFYSGIPFYKGAWNSLRYQVVNIDFPISVALISGFLLSTVNLIRGSGAIYFDSTAGFIFLILCSRYYLKRSQQKFLNSQSLGNELTKDHYYLLENGKNKVVAAQDIKVGQLLCLHQGQTCPVDGTLQTDSTIDLAVLNGEPLPRQFEKGMTVLAGSKILSEPTEVLVAKQLNDTYLSTLLSQLKANEFSKSNFTSMTDKVAQGLIFTVSALAFVYFLFYFQTDFQEAFNRSLALIVLACPCALAFGAPLALNLALRKAENLGILIKQSSAIEKFWNIKNIYFDKTGTLTSLNLKVIRTEPEYLSSEVKSLMLGLEKSSYHPIAFALRDFLNGEKRIQLKNVEEKSGVGIRGDWQGFTYSLIQNQHCLNPNEISVSLYKESSKIASVFLESPLNPGTIDTLHELQEKGINCYLASGDLPKKVQFIGSHCGIPKDQIFGGLTAQSKKQLIQSSPNSCMIGDGSNDALALQAATVGIAVKGSTYVNLQAADIYFTREGLDPLLDLIQLSQQTRKVLTRNLVFALVYNGIGGALALMGFVDPWLAAVLMPTSSVLIITSTVWGFR